MTVKEFQEQIKAGIPRCAARTETVRSHHQPRAQA